MNQLFRSSRTEQKQDIFRCFNIAVIIYIILVWIYFYRKYIRRQYRCQSTQTEDNYEETVSNKPRTNSLTICSTAAAIKFVFVTLFVRKGLFILKSCLRFLLVLVTMMQQMVDEATQPDRKKAVSEGSQTCCTSDVPSMLVEIGENNTLDDIADVNKNLNSDLIIIEETSEVAQAGTLNGPSVPAENGESKTTDVSRGVNNNRNSHPITVEETSEAAQAGTLNGPSMSAENGKSKTTYAKKNSKPIILEETRDSEAANVGTLNDPSIPAENDKSKTTDVKKNRNSKPIILGNERSRARIPRRSSVTVKHSKTTRRRKIVFCEDCINKVAGKLSKEQTYMPGEYIFCNPCLLTIKRCDGTQNTSTSDSFESDFFSTTSSAAESDSGETSSKIKMKLRSRSKRTLQIPCRTHLEDSVAGASATSGDVNSQQNTNDTNRKTSRRGCNNEKRPTRVKNNDIDARRTSRKGTNNETRLHSCSCKTIIVKAETIPREKKLDCDNQTSSSNSDDLHNICEEEGQKRNKRLPGKPFLRKCSNKGEISSVVDKEQPLTSRLPKTDTNNNKSQLSETKEKSAIIACEQDVFDETEASITPIVASTQSSALLDTEDCQSKVEIEQALVSIPAPTKHTPQIPEALQVVTKQSLTSLGAVEHQPMGETEDAQFLAPSEEEYSSSESIQSISNFEQHSPSSKPTYFAESNTAVATSDYSHSDSAYVKPIVENQHKSIRKQQVRISPNYISSLDNKETPMYSSQHVPKGGKPVVSEAISEEEKPMSSPVHSYTQPESAPIRPKADNRHEPLTGSQSRVPHEHSLPISKSNVDSSSSSQHAEAVPAVKTGNTPAQKSPSTPKVGSAYPQSQNDFKRPQPRPESQNEPSTENQSKHSGRSVPESKDKPSTKCQSRVPHEGSTPPSSQSSKRKGSVVSKYAVQAIPEYNGPKRSSRENILYEILARKAKLRQSFEGDVPPIPRIASDNVFGPRPLSEDVTARKVELKSRVEPLTIPMWRPRPKPTVIRKGLIPICESVKEEQTKRSTPDETVSDTSSTWANYDSMESKARTIPKRSPIGSRHKPKDESSLEKGNTTDQLNKGGIDKDRRQTDRHHLTTRPTNTSDKDESQTLEGTSRNEVLAPIKSSAFKRLIDSSLEQPEFSNEVSSTNNDYYNIIHKCRYIPTNPKTPPLVEETEEEPEEQWLLDENLTKTTSSEDENDNEGSLELDYQDNNTLSRKESVVSGLALNK